MKLVYKGYVYEAYSKENSHLLNYAKTFSGASYDIEELRYLFRDWMQDTHPELEDLDYMDDLDFSDLKDRYEEYFDEFENALENGLYRNEPEVFSSTRRNMDLMNQKILPNNTLLVHFSDNANYIAQEGFTVGADDISNLGITRHVNKGYESKGYNFAFLADSRDADFTSRSGKYGKDAVLFRNSGVHFFHYGDDENQVVFHGPDVKEFILLRKVYGDFRVIGNDSYTAKEYLFDPTLTRKSESSYMQCVKWVETNWQQYRKVLFWNVK